MRNKIGKSNFYSSAQNQIRKRAQMSSLGSFVTDDVLKTRSPQKRYSMLGNFQICNQCTRTENKTDKLDFRVKSNVKSTVVTKRIFSEKEGQINHNYISANPVYSRVYCCDSFHWVNFVDTSKITVFFNVHIFNTSKRPVEYFQNKLFLTQCTGRVQKTYRESSIRRPGPRSLLTAVIITTHVCAIYILRDQFLFDFRATPAVVLLDVSGTLSVSPFVRNRFVRNRFVRNHAFLFA